MFPHKVEWSKWTTIEKASYIAQVLTPFSLLVTVIFSFLAWDASRESSALQVLMFQAQNSPNIVFDDVYLSQSSLSSILVVPLRNAGESVAQEVCVTLYNAATLKPFNRSCEKGRPFFNLRLQKTQTFKMPISSIAEIEREIGFLPQRFYSLDIDKEPKRCGSERAAVVLLGVDYKDALGGDYGQLKNILMCN